MREWYRRVVGAGGVVGDLHDLRPSIDGRSSLAPTHSRTREYPHTHTHTRARSHARTHPHALTRARFCCLKREMMTLTLFYMTS